MHAAGLSTASGGVQTVWLLEPKGFIGIFRNMSMWIVGKSALSPGFYTRILTSA